MNLRYYMRPIVAMVAIAGGVTIAMMGLNGLSEEKSGAKTVEVKFLSSSEHQNFAGDKCVGIYQINMEITAIGADRWIMQKRNRSKEDPPLMSLQFGFTYSIRNKLSHSVVVSGETVDGSMVSFATKTEGNVIRLPKGVPVHASVNVAYTPSQNSHYYVQIDGIAISDTPNGIPEWHSLPTSGNFMSDSLALCK